MRFVFFVFFFVFSFQLFASDYFQELDLRSKEEKLSQDRFWHLLLHYRKSPWGGVVSEFDSGEFFQSPQGKVDPQSELNATLKSFFKPNQSGSDFLHPQCVFPARYKWLKERLNFDPSRLPEIDCLRFKEWRNSLDTKSLTIAFSSYYIENPASMFGHSMVKLDLARNEENELLDYAVNFSAQATDVNPVLYMYYGLTGGFIGKFQIFPYYYKVTEYSDMESRDMFEYRLDLNEEQIDWFLLHIWETSPGNVDYKFFTKNCSYMLLGVLEVANPNLNLVNKASRFTFPPPESIRILFTEPGLVKQMKYRPSVYSKILQKVENMTEKEKEILYTHLDSIQSFQEIQEAGVRKALILDALLETFRYRKESKKGKEEEESVYKKYLKYRSEIADEYELKKESQWSSNPELSHGNSQAALGRGGSSLGGFTDFRLRYNYHDLLNSDAGNYPNSEIQLFHFHFRKYDLETKPRLEKLTLMGFSAFSPYNPINKARSLHFSLGWDSFMHKTDYKDEVRDLVVLSQWNLVEPDLIFAYSFSNYLQNIQSNAPRRVSAPGLELGYGYSYQDIFHPKRKNFVMNAALGLKAQMQRELETGFRVGPALYTNFIYSYKKWKMHLQMNYFHFQLTDNPNDFAGNLKLRYSLETNHEIRIEWNNQRNYSEVLLSYFYLF